MSDIPERELAVPPGRGLEYVGVHPERGLEALCDCGTVTILTIDPEEIRHLAEAQEVPFECETCHTVHWLTTAPVREQP